MMSGLIVALIVQWIVLVVLCLMVLLLFRQVGLLHERLGPVGALSLPGGLAAGEAMPRFELLSLAGQSVPVGGIAADGMLTFLFFVSPTCPVCKSLFPAFRALAREQGVRARFILASDGEADRQRAMVDEQKLGDFPFVLSTDLGRRIGVSRLPFAALVSADGTLIAKGLVNSREHLESLFEAADLNVASVQAYLSNPQLVKAQ